jgi:hypothetical protein
MPEETEYLGRTAVEGDGYMEADRYKVHCRCLRCGRKYTRFIERISDPDPPCPYKACQKAIAREKAEKETRHVEAMIETGETPGHVGANNRVKAIDATAEIVMQDYGMTDLKDNTRQGESMAPQLTPRQRAMDKDFWGGRKLNDRRNPTYLKGIPLNEGSETPNQGLGARALNGAFLPNVVGSQPRDSVTGDNLLRQIHGNRYKPPVEIVFDTNRIPKKKP